MTTVTWRRPLRQYRSKESMQSSEDKVVGPGDIVASVPSSGQLRLGPGLLAHEDGAIKTLRNGLLRQTQKSGQLWLEGKERRYIPVEGDVVVGIIQDRHGENFIVQINGPFTALLPQLSFEGATKRNRPNLKSGDVVYARVQAASRDMEPVLTCVDAAGQAAGLGHLKTGMMLNVSTATARKLLSNPPAIVLRELGASLEFEVAAGANGWVWVSSTSMSTCVLVAGALQKSQGLTDAQIKILVAHLVAQQKEG